MTYRRLLVLVAAAVAGLVAGCRNPFDPTADIRFRRFQANSGYIATINADPTNVTNIINSKWDSFYSVTMEISLYSSVPVSWRNYTVVYRQVAEQVAQCGLPPGSPICSLGGAGGRRFPMRVHSRGLLSNDSVPVTDTISLRPFSEEFLKYVSGNGEAVSGGIDVDITVQGEDHNGHDVEVSGTLHVEVYN
jgi:hypothetical protein